MHKKVLLIGGTNAGRVVETIRDYVHLPVLQNTRGSFFDTDAYFQVEEYNVHTYHTGWGDTVYFGLLQDMTPHEAILELMDAYTKHHRG